MNIIHEQDTIRREYAIEPKPIGFEWNYDLKRVGYIDTKKQFDDVFKSYLQQGFKINLQHSKDVSDIFKIPNTKVERIVFDIKGHPNLSGLLSRLVGHQGHTLYKTS